MNESDAQVFLRFTIHALADLMNRQAIIMHALQESPETLRLLENQDSPGRQQERLADILTRMEQSLGRIATAFPNTGVERVIRENMRHWQKTNLQ